MTTARTQLHAQLIALLQDPKNDKLADEVNSILSGYRLQFKSKTASGRQQPQTARQALGERLQLVAKQGPDDLASTLALILDDYRMQHKAPSKARAKKNAKPGVGADKQQARAELPASASANATSGKATAGKVAAPSAPAASPAKPKKSRAQPVVARPSSRRGVTRSECPKCHSMGVVLARSYAEDEYYSCIYCGWQGFKVAPAGEEQDSLAARLLGIYKREADS